MMRSPVKVLLGNLALSNLVSAVFVQLISAILGGYAVATNTFEVEVEFCRVWEVARRATWAVLPATSLTLQWVLLLPQVHPSSTSCRWTSGWLQSPRTLK